MTPAEEFAPRSRRGDDATTVAELRELVERFVAEREWSKYHSPKNLAMSIAIEAAELMEHFQWLTPEQAQAVADDPEKRAAAGEELADVVGYCFAMAGALGLDLSETVRSKMRRNHDKYPADVFRGRASYDRPGGE
ncbi:nucleotide pyrophosphohydrolase [Botrimarina sp.]|uniref:nucleotide pyrophosphohydrolase n=1 Tax=Botrimarina sp. TaxID=2795802 RepID=UPI0032EE1C52